MAATPICTGPVATWVAGAGSVTPLFFGYGSVAPQSQIFARWTKVLSDRTGGMVPRDKMYQGQEALIFIEFAEWSDAVRESIAATPVPNVAKAGVNSPGDIGTLAITEGAYFILYMVYPYSFNAGGHPVFRTGGANPIVPGYRFVGTTLESMTRKDGTQPNAALCNFHAIPVLNYLTGALTLYDHNLTAIPSLLPQ
jgi:hypothetical protein